MNSKVFFSNMAYTKYEAEQTLPSKLGRQLKEYGPGSREYELLPVM
ncbi:MAG: hypothetical protein FWD78_14540 [Treponema sp.]|nr:hypothetical protein [Treponema sp.]